MQEKQNIENQYLDLLVDIRNNGKIKSSGRAGMPNTQSVFGRQMRQDLSEGFPLYTSKKINFWHIIYELNWFIKGYTTVKYLEYHKARFWHEDSYSYYKMVAEAVKRGISEQNDFIYNGAEILSSMYRNAHEKDATGLLQSELFKYDGKIFDEKLDRLELPNPMEYRLLTKEEYLEILKDWGDATRSCDYTPEELDKQIMNHKTVIHGFDSDNQFDVCIREYTDGKYNSYDFGDCGDQYGYLWRNVYGANNQGDSWGRVDQFGQVLRTLVENPYSRRNLIDSWNVGTLGTMALNACHPLVQFDVTPKDDTNVISTHFYMRSNDMFLGNPYNIAFYGLLTHILSMYSSYEVGDLIYSGGDCHIYDNQFDAVDTQTKRTPTALPSFEHFEMTDSDRNDFFKVSIEDPRNRGNQIYVGLDNMLDRLYNGLKDYNPQGFIKGILSTGN